MATPLSATKALSVLRAEGLTVVEYGSWKTHNRGQRGDGWSPLHGVMLHHTVTHGRTRTETNASVKLCYNGHSTLPGPLCHGVIDKQGVVHMVGWGRANHAGLGDPDVLRAVIAEDPLPEENQNRQDGNARFYGFELINMGDNKDPWPRAQVEAAVRASAALLRAHGWGKNGKTSVIAHKEWQDGKIDPRGPGWPGMTTVRDRVAERLKHPAGWDPDGDDTPPPADNDPGDTFTYTVKKGDTLGVIARRFSTTVDEIVNLNDRKIEDPDEISPGLKLTIRGQKPAPATYTVRKGDTLGAIARKFNTTVDRLVQLNPTKIEDPDEISPGLRLKLR